MARHPVTRRKVFDYLCRYKEENDGHPPTYEEISAEFGWQNPSTAWTHVQGLERDGLVKLDSRRRITLINGEYNAPEGADPLGRRDLRLKE